jgi:hypothetical protein
VGLLAACGGAIASSERDGGSDRDAGRAEAGGPDGAADAEAWSPVCPPIAPAVGGACNVNQATCEYGNLQYEVGCNTVITCDNFVWTSFDAGLPCVPDAPNPSSCPSSLALVEAQGTLPCAPSGANCAYPQGVCPCATPLGLPDGSPTTWNGCYPGQGCPMPRPRLGSPCSGHDVGCVYQPCSFGQYCLDGAWRLQPGDDCPVSGGG